MKATLEFNTEDPYDNEAFIRATKATTLYIVVHEYLQELRKVWKYSDVDVDIDHAEKWRDTLIELLQSHGIDLDRELS